MFKKFGFKKFGLMGLILAAATLFHPAAANAQQVYRGGGYYTQPYGSYRPYGQRIYDNHMRRDWRRDEWIRAQQRQWAWAHRGYGYYPQAYGYYPPPVYYAPPAYYAPPRAGVYFSFGAR